MAEIIWTEPALQDLDTIADYIALDKPEAAAKLVQRVFARVEMLTSHPGLGSKIPELNPGTRYRQLVESPCRLFYRHEKKTGKIFIVGVMRGEKRFHRQILVREG